ncbi:MAG TPA: GFA family protein [Polyangia bacterium]|jgi:hypothetical protein|nr:GFA family protein [Polyangia bacterium]
MTQVLTKQAHAKAALSHSGGCFCGAIQIRVTGEPVAVGYCHCQSCRQWSAGPVNAFMLWKPEMVEVTQGRDLLGGYRKTERSHRRWCQTCGGHLFTEHPAWGLIDVYAAAVPEFPFRPAVHVNYSESVLKMTDGLPKQHDLPSEMGGSGQLVPE